MNTQPYLQLKLALELFKKPPRSLSKTETTRLAEVVRHQRKIEAAILASPEAMHVVVSEATLAARLSEVRKRYPTRNEFLDDMRQHGLSEQVLETALTRDLRIEAVLERVAAQIPDVSEVDAEIYYRLHPQSFTRPETRRIRHILITFDTPTQKQDAHTLLASLRAAIKTPEDFAAAALKHSQCPTALEGGVIGAVKPRQLFPELDAPAFALAEGELSAPLETPVGLHLLMCETIYPESTLSFDEAKARVIDHLTEQRRQGEQQRWIKGVLKG
ncbi:MAG: nitrogen fixation protein NifM [Zoogloeaceae bacterium]|jgi:nitrogen fixation protein NifM|nr:nitrogen fixation protein NifM [Zoogloeaceae bacterium]